MRCGCFIVLYGLCCLLLLEEKWTVCRRRGPLVAEAVECAAHWRRSVGESGGVGRGSHDRADTLPTARSERAAAFYCEGDARLRRVTRPVSKLARPCEHATSTRPDTHGRQETRPCFKVIVIDLTRRVPRSTAGSICAQVIERKTNDVVARFIRRPCATVDVP